MFVYAYNNSRRNITFGKLNLLVYIFSGFSGFNFFTCSYILFHFFNFYCLNSLKLGGKGNEYNTV